MTHDLACTNTSLRTPPRAPDDTSARSDLSRRLETTKSLAGTSAWRLLPAFTMNTLFYVTVLSRVTFVGGEACQRRSGHP